MHDFPGTTAFVGPELFERAVFFQHFPYCTEWFFDRKHLCRKENGLHQPSFSQTLWMASTFLLRSRLCHISFPPSPRQSLLPLSFSLTGLFCLGVAALIFQRHSKPNVADGKSTVAQPSILSFKQAHQSFSHQKFAAIRVQPL